MTKQVMQYRVCDHCTQDRDAVVTDKVSINGERYELDLCRRHSAELHAFIERWTSKGKMVGKPTVFDQQRQITGPTLVKLGATREPHRVEPEPEVEQKPTPVVRDEPLFPPTAHKWEFTEHALERMEEREISEEEVRTAAELPERVVPSRNDHDLEVRLRGDVKVVVNPRTFYIVTTARVDQPSEDAVLQAGAV